MNLALSLITIANTFALIYLTYLIYRKGLLAKQDKAAKNIANLEGKNIKMNLIRFNPFDEVGSNQSFILCLLDSDNCGVIITSLHNRDFTRVYAKSIKNGQPDATTLTAEEKTALKNAISN